MLNLVRLVTSIAEDVTMNLNISIIAAICWTSPFAVTLISGSNSHLTLLFHGKPWWLQHCLVFFLPWKVFWFRQLPLLRIFAVFKLQSEALDLEQPCCQCIWVLARMGASLTHSGRSHLPKPEPQSWHLFKETQKTLQGFKHRCKCSSLEKREHSLVFVGFSRGRFQAHEDLQYWAGKSYAMIVWNLLFKQRGKRD